MTSTNTTSSPRRLNVIILWALQIIGAIAFIAAGTFKLIAAPQMVEIFNQIGFGQWLRVVTGVVEVSGGLALLWPSIAVFGAALLATTMFFATMTHVFLIGGSPLPAMVLLAVTATIVWLRRDQLRAMAKY